MAENLEQAGLDAVDKFIDTWNSRDPVAWAGSLHFPHVRPSPVGAVHVAPDAEDYISRVDYQQVIDSGWDHSEWDYKHVLQVSPSRIHVAGQWSRYSAAGDVILTTPIVYICTRLEDGWGIQSRFGADYAEDDDTVEMMTRGLNLVQDFNNQQNAGNHEACAELLNYPHFNIGIGELGITENAAAFTPTQGVITIESLQAIQTGRRSMNAAVDITLQSGGESQSLQGVIHINNRDGHLGIQAWSFLNPYEAMED